MLVITEMKHLLFDGRSLRMIPKVIFQEAKAAFEKAQNEQQYKDDPTFGRF